MNMKASNENYILVDSSKFVEKLGEKHPVPIECEIEKVDNAINEIIKLGLGPNIPLRKHLTQLNNDVNLDNNLNSLEIININKKRFSLEKEIRKKRYEFLKITEL